MELRVVKLNPQVTWLELIGQLWEDTELKEFQQTISQRVSSGNMIIVVDLSRVTFVNSQGLGLFMSTFILAQKSNCRLIFFKPKGCIQELMELSGFYSVMTIVHNRTELEAQGIVT